MSTKGEPNDGQETTKILQTTLWYKRACIMQKRATTFFRRYEPLKGTSTKMSLQNQIQTKKLCRTQL